MRPIVLCFSGLDPSGGAGIQADIEAIMQSGSFATTACTALTLQNSQQVFDILDMPDGFVAQASHIIANDLPIGCIKSGMLYSTENINVIRAFIQSHTVPYVLDPVFKSNSGNNLSHSNTLFLDALKSLLPLTTLITPNTVELHALTGEPDIHLAAQKLFDMGAHNILIKGAHQNLPSIRHQLFSQGKLVYLSEWPRLDGEYHGSGCSLASFIAGKLAQKVDLLPAIQQAEIWLHQTLRHSDIPHKNGQRIPNRSIKGHI